MNERQGLRMECQATKRVSLCSIFFVAGDRVAYPFRMNSDLILASGLQLELDLGVWGA